ncbi:hypothetical protein CLOM_g12856 [Closterium sp. NIES-68]|nr:hypothetical protein CLOM_g12856 [Closterium sp. NIES-68]
MLVVRKGSVWGVADFLSRLDDATQHSVSYGDDATQYSVSYGDDATQRYASHGDDEAGFRDGKSSHFDRISQGGPREQRGEMTGGKLPRSRGSEGWGREGRGGWEREGCSCSCGAERTREKREAVSFNEGRAEPLQYCDYPPAAECLLKGWSVRASQWDSAACWVDPEGMRRRVTGAGDGSACAPSLRDASGGTCSSCHSTGGGVHNADEMFCGSSRANSSGTSSSSDSNGSSSSSDGGSWGSGHDSRCHGWYSDGQSHREGRCSAGGRHSRTGGRCCWEDSNSDGNTNSGGRLAGHASDEAGDSAREGARESSRDRKSGWVEKAFRVSSSSECASTNILTAQHRPRSFATPPAPSALFPHSARLPLCLPLILSFLLLLLLPLSPARAQVLPSTFRVLSFVDTFCASPLVPPDRREDGPVMGPLPGGNGGGTSAGGAQKSGAGGVGPNCAVTVSTGLLPSQADNSSSDTYNSTAWRLTYVLAVGVVPTDFDWPDQTVQSIRVNGREMLTAGPCRPVGRCGGTRPFACYMGDVSWALPARNSAAASSNTTGNPTVNATLTVTVTASAKVAQPCRLCGGFQQLPCQVLQAAVRLTAVLVPVSLQQPQPGQPLQEQAPAGAATAVGPATASGSGNGSGKVPAAVSGAVVAEGGGAAAGGAPKAAAEVADGGAASTSAPVPLQSRLAASPAAQAATAAGSSLSSSTGVVAGGEGVRGEAEPPARAVTVAPGVAVSFVRGPGGVSKVPRSRFSWQALETKGVHTAVRCDGCTYVCKLDSLPAFPCPRGWFTARGLTDGPHLFTVTAVKGAKGITGSRLQAAAAAVGGGEVGGAQVEAQAQATYEWVVDAASPVPTLTVDPPQAREGSVRINITFDKPCLGLQCTATACDIEASPQGIVTIDASSFTASQDGSSYSATATLPSITSSSGAESASSNATNSTSSSGSAGSSNGAVTVALRPGSCADSSGRAWTAGFDSYAVIRIDQDSLEATLSCDTPFAVVKFFTQLRATPRVSQSPVTCRVLFSKPVRTFSSASLAVVNATSSEPQAVSDVEYEFQVWPTGEGSVVVDIRSADITDAAGNICQPTQPFFFFFDTTPPTVQLSSSESSTDTDWVYPILVAFSEPVLGFNSSSLQLSNGVITCWTGVDRGLGRYYEVTVAAVSDGEVTVSVPGATVVDIAGNLNSPSNTLSLTHYAPGDAGTITAWVVTAVLGWTALSTATVSLAVTIKESDPTSSPGIRIVSNRPFRAVSTPVVGADPSRNILRMALHLQVFALTQHLAVRVLPLFYRQLTGGLRWTYFYIPPPFKSSFDGWKGVYATPTDAPGQNSSDPQPSCAPLYLATRGDSAASSSSSSNPSSAAPSKFSPSTNTPPPEAAAAAAAAADSTSAHPSSRPSPSLLHPRNLRRVLSSSLRSLLSSLASPSLNHVSHPRTMRSSRSIRNTANSMPAHTHAHAHMQARQLQSATSHVHMRHAMSHHSISHHSLAHGRRLGSSRALPFLPIPTSPSPTRLLRGLPLSPASLSSSSASFHSSLYSSFPSHTPLSTSHSPHPSTHYHRMLQAQTDSTTSTSNGTSSNSSATGYSDSYYSASGFNASAFVALAAAGGGAGGNAAAVAAAGGFDPTLLPLLSEEEYDYMQAWGDAYYSHYPNLFYSYHGFEQFCTVLFWFAIFFFALSLLQLLFQWAWQHWRYQWLYGLLDPPRLQFLLLALSLLAVSWGCTLLIRGSMEPGGTAAGLAVGVIVLNLWPVLFLIFSFSVVWYIVVQEQFARFFVREMTEPRNEACIASFARTFWAALRQKRLKGHWVTITPSQKHILPRFGIFFEDFTVWGSVGAWGVLKDRLRAAYGTLDFLKMVLVGVLVGAWSPAANSIAQQACLLVLAFLQLLFLLFLQPFTERGLQVVEAVSVGAEVVLFTCSLVMAIDWDMSSNAAGTLGLVMALAVGAAFIGQLFNHWVALGQQINRMLNPPDDERSPSHRSDGDDFSDNDDDDLDDDDDDEDFDDEDDGNGDEDEEDDDDDYDDDDDDEEVDTSMDEGERIRQQQQQGQ